MLLRRITQHIKDQNWFAVFVDFLIVVVGVFIGIQVANWNNSLADTRLSQFYVDSMINDLNLDLTSQKNQLEYYKSVRDSLLLADRLLAETNPDSKTLVLAAYRATEIGTVTANRSIWDQVISSGHIGLIPENVLSAGLANYYRRDSNSHLNLSFLANSPYRKAVRTTIPLPVQIKIREACSDVRGDNYFIKGFSETCVLKIDSQTLDEVAAAIKFSEVIKAEIRHHYSSISNYIYRGESNLAVIENFIQILKNEKAK